MRLPSRLVLALVLCSLLALPGVQIDNPAAKAGESGSWTKLPLYGVDVGSIVIDPANPSILYASSFSTSRIRGVWRSANAGATWALVNSGLSSGGSGPAYPASPTCLAIDPLSTSTLYAGTDSNGVYRSTDSGSTWQARVMHSDFSVAAYSLAIDPTTPSIVYAGVSYFGCFRSKDGGETWVRAGTGLPMARATRSLVIDPTNPSILYAATGETGFYRSADAGDNWTAADNAWATADNADLAKREIRCLAVGSASPTILYASTDGGRVFRTTDGGNTWINVSTGLPQIDMYAVAAAPGAPATLYAGGFAGLSGGQTAVYVSSNTGTTWVALGSPGLVDRDVRCIAVDPVTPTTVYVGTDDGIFRYGVKPVPGVVVTVALAATSWPASGGSVSKTPDQSSYAVGSTVTLTAKPADGYSFTGWSGDLSGETNPVTVKVDAEKHITARFTENVIGIILLTIGSTKMLVNGVSVTLEVAPMILNSRTLLPIRAVVDAVGGTIAWDASTRKVTVVRKDKTVLLWINKNSAQVNARSVQVDTDVKVVPIIVGGRTLLPLRFVAESLGLDVQWNGATKVITITYTP
jgi:photosystem II stability/assembly factor-like uncharacterized protein